MILSFMSFLGEVVKIATWLFFVICGGNGSKMPNVNGIIYVESSLSRLKNGCIQIWTIIIASICSVKPNKYLNKIMERNRKMKDKKLHFLLHFQPN